MSGTGNVGASNAPVTPVDLYRDGNTTNARMDHVRSKDAQTYFDSNGVEWVKANSGRGISTSDVPRPFGKQWFLAAGHPVPPGLIVRNDRRNHWQWEPAQDMPMVTYKTALASLHPFFK